MAFDLGSMLAKQRPEGTDLVAQRERTIEEYTYDIIRNKEQAGAAILEIGRGLIAVKALLPHGEWLPWLTERVEFSERTAQNFMRLAREYSNQQTLADLGYARALTLLALPAKERDEFICESHKTDDGDKTVIDMSSRELEKAIRERKEALEAKETAEAEARAAEQARAKMAEEAKMAQRRIDDLIFEAEAHQDTVEQLREELEELRARPIDITATNVPDEAALEAARRIGAEEAAREAKREAEEKLHDRLEKAARAKADADEALKAAKANLETMKAKAEELERQVKVAGSKELATAAVCFETAQENVNKVLGCIQKLALVGNVEEHNGLIDNLHSWLSALDARVPKKLEVSGVCPPPTARSA